MNHVIGKEIGDEQIRDRTLLKRNKIRMLIMLFILISCTLLDIENTLALIIPIPADVRVISSVRLPVNATYEPQPFEGPSGNITEFEVIFSGGDSSSWQGYFGNVSGEIILSNVDFDNLYRWIPTDVSGEIYATRASIVDFTMINCSDLPHIFQEETALGQTNSTLDRVNSTFSQANHPSLSVGNVPVAGNSCPSTRILGNNSNETSSFYELLLVDDLDNVIYTAIIAQNEIAFNGNITDFQMIVGENSSGGNTETTAYYFYVDLW